MSATVHEFPEADQAERDRRGTGVGVTPTPVASKPRRADLSPTQKVSVAYSYTWRGAARCAAGTDLGAGYRLMSRASMGGLTQTMGPVRAADYLMRLAYEAAGKVLEGAGNDDGPEAA